MNKNILLVEDDSFFQKFYVNKLTENGFKVDVASNGKEGIEKIANGSFDLILLDLVMPLMNGFEFLKIKNMDEKLMKIPVIVFSSLSQENDIEEAKKSGASEFINKTFYNFDELLNKINNILMNSS